MGLTQQQRDALLKQAVDGGVADMLPESLREKLATHGYAGVAQAAAGLQDLSGYTLVREIGEKLAFRRAENKLIRDGLSDLAELAQG